MLENQVVSFCRPLCPPGTPIAVAVSGGADSMALADLMCRVCDILSLPTPALLHVNHALRGAESDADEALVVDFARGRGLVCHCTRLPPHDASPHGLEAWARECRYRFFADMRHSHGYHLVATGHTADDQAETVLLRLMRGAGISGIAGIRPLRDDGVFRPVLMLRRSELRTWLRDRGIAWREDQSNTDQRFARNHIRHDVLPRLRLREPQADILLTRCAETAQRLGHLLEPAMNNWRRAHVINDSLTRFTVLPPEKEDDLIAAAEVMAEALRQRDIALTTDTVERIFDAANCRGGRTILLPGSWCMKTAPGRWNFFGPGELERFCGWEPQTLSVPGCVHIEPIGITLHARYDGGGGEPEPFDRTNRVLLLDANRLALPLTVRRMGVDDRWVPWGMDHAVRLAMFLKKRGVPAFERAGHAVVVDQLGRVACVPLQGVSVPHGLNAQTSRIIRIEYEIRQ